MLCGVLAALGVLALLSGCASQPRPDAEITGRAFAKTRLYIPPDAVFEAALFDVTNEAGPPVALGRQRVEPAGQAPFDLAIPFRQGQIQRNGKYVVQAQVTLYNQLLYYTPVVNPVLQDPAYRRVDVLLEPYARTAATADAAVPFERTHWKLVSLGEGLASRARREAEGAAPAYIQFQPDGQTLPPGRSRGGFVGSGGCNRFLGTYEMQGAALRMQLADTSIRLCLEGGRDEPEFLRSLSRVRAFMQSGRDLVMRDEDDKPFLRFRAQEAGEAGFEPYEPPNSPQ